MNFRVGKVEIENHKSAMTANMDFGYLRKLSIYNCSTSEHKFDRFSKIFEKKAWEAERKEQGGSE